MSCRPVLVRIALLPLAAALIAVPAGAAPTSTTGAPPPAILDSPARALSVGAGSPAHPFAIADLAGKPYDLSPVLGKNAIVISFWSIYCDSCVKEMLALQRLEDKYKGKDLTILAVNEDIRVPTERIVRFLDRLSRFRGKISYPVLFDKDSAVFARYGGVSLPTTILIDRDGKVFSSYQGFTVDSEEALLQEIESVIAGKPSPPPHPQARVQTFTVTGRAGVCGFFDKSGWRKGFNGNTSLEQEVAVVREIARRDAQRQSVLAALGALGMTPYAREPLRDSVDEKGIHVDRDPFDTDDPVGKLLSELKYAKFFELIEDQDKLIGNDLFVSRTVRVNLDDLMDELEGMGFLASPNRINFTYVNMSRLDQKEFINALLSQSRFIGKVEDPVFTPATTSQAFEIYAPTEGFAREIQKMDFGKLKVFVEEVTPASLELEVWK
jgi:cytochrome c biogenesis protein CcmG, thiol:disulfide interchange protein DsbE